MLIILEKQNLKDILKQLNKNNFGNSLTHSTHNPNGFLHDFSYIWNTSFLYKPDSFFVFQIFLKIPFLSEITLPTLNIISLLLSLT